ncbi:MAG: TcpQ domain-containing protein, partial [Acidithiobacillus sp.]
MRSERHGLMGGAVVGAVFAALPVLGLHPAMAWAASLSVAPVLLNAGGAAVPSAVATPQGATTSPPPATPLNLKGYARWKSPLKTLEMVGYGVTDLRSSYGSSIPLKDALRLILPVGWHVYAKSGVSGESPVTWKATEQPWTTPLRYVLRQAGLIGTVNWPHTALLLRVKPTPAVPPLNTKGYTAWGGAPRKGAAHTSFHFGAVSTSSPPLQNATPVFLLNQGDLILTDLQKWAKQSGWTVVWQVPEDWQVPNTTTFSG